MQLFQAIAIMAGLCFTGSIDTSQLGVQAVQGALFIFISENTFSPMYSVLSLFPQMFPLFLRETKSGLYNTAQYYIATIIAMVSSKSDSCHSHLSNVAHIFSYLVWYWSPLYSLSLHIGWRSCEAPPMRLA